MLSVDWGIGASAARQGSDVKKCAELEFLEVGDTVKATRDLTYGGDSAAIANRFISKGTLGQLVIPPAVGGQGQVRDEEQTGSPPPPHCIIAQHCAMA